MIALRYTITETLRKITLRGRASFKVIQPGMAAINKPARSPRLASHHFGWLDKVFVTMSGKITKGYHVIKADSWRGLITLYSC